MPYNANFYDAYQQYLLEPQVRRAHDWVIQKFSCKNVLDLGCGRSCEFYNYRLLPCYRALARPLREWLEEGEYLTSAITINFTSEFSTNYLH